MHWFYHSRKMVCKSSSLQQPPVWGAVFLQCLRQSRLLETCSLALWSRDFQAWWITLHVQALASLHIRQSRQPAGITAWHFSNHDARQTLCLDSLGWNGFWPMGWRWRSSCKFHSFLLFNSDAKSHQNLTRLLSSYDYGDHISYLEIQYGFVWKYSIKTDTWMLDSFCWLRSFLYVYACTHNISCSKVAVSRERDTFFECLNLAISNHNIPKQMKNKVGILHHSA